MNKLSHLRLLSYLVIRAVKAASKFPLQADLRGGLLQKVRDPLHKEVSVLQVCKQKGHAVLGAYGQWAGQHVGAVCFLHNGHLKEIEEHSQSKSTIFFPLSN